jgi:predicted  nucleic acid-binding Zn-ribbon protein
VSLATWFKERRLRSVERKIKVLHVKQRKVRTKLSDLESERKRGKITEAVFKAKHAKFDAERKAATEKLNRLIAEEASLKAELGLKGKAPVA